MRRLELGQPYRVAHVLKLSAWQSGLQYQPRRSPSSEELLRGHINQRGSAFMHALTSNYVYVYTRIIVSGQQSTETPAESIDALIVLLLEAKLTWALVIQQGGR